MTPPEKKRCPRCYCEFFCNHENIALCDCSKIKMTVAEREKISKLYSDCLCVKCLEELLLELRKRML